jgi:hypothetical protein
MRCRFDGISPFLPHFVHTLFTIVDQNSTQYKIPKEVVTMKNRIFFSVVGILVLVCGLIALGFYVYNLGAASAADQSVELPAHPWHFGYFPPLLGVAIAVIGFMFLLKIAIPLILFPIFGIGFWGARRHWRGYGPRHWRRMDWEEGVPPMVRSWHRHLHEMAADDEAPAEE